MRRACVTALPLLCAALLSGCHQDMWNQPNFSALEQSGFFADGAASRPPVHGTVVYEGARRPWAATLYARLKTNSADPGDESVPPVTDDYFWTGKEDGVLVPENYFDVNLELIKRGQSRFEVHCTPCHGGVGDGKGVVTMRGFPNPPSYHIDRLREVEDGHLYDVMTNGFGRMFSARGRVAPEDRWAIIAYIRALQYSQNVDIMDETGPISREEVKQGILDQAEDAEEAPDEHGTTETDDHVG